MTAKKKKGKAKAPKDDGPTRDEDGKTEETARPGAPLSADDDLAPAEEAPIFRREPGDPDFETTVRMRPDPGAHPEKAPPDPPSQPGDPDQDRSIATTLITLIKNVFTSATPAPAAARAAPPPLVPSFPADQPEYEDSFDSVQSVETAEAVREALKRMERGEDPFDEDGSA